MTDDDVRARLDSIEQKLDRILAALIEPVTATGIPDAPGQVSGGLRDHEGQDAR